MEEAEEFVSNRTNDEPSGLTPDTEEVDCIGPVEVLEALEGGACQNSTTAMISLLKEETEGEPVDLESCLEDEVPRTNSADASVKIFMIARNEQSNVEINEKTEEDTQSETRSTFKSSDLRVEQGEIEGSMEEELAASSSPIQVRKIRNRKRERKKERKKV